jgi:hypothetical protein
MSTEIWIDPNDKTKRYAIGTEGLEHSSTGILGGIADIFRTLYPYAKIPAALAMGLLDWDANSAVPTYGLWAGPGWGGDERTSEFRGQYT